MSNIILYHYPICPFSRSIRIILAEKSIPFELKLEKFWERSFNLAKLNPAVEVPVLVDNNSIICESLVIYEYLEAKYPTVTFLTDNLENNVEIKRLCFWFSQKIYNEAIKYFLDEKLIKFFINKTPNSTRIKIARTNLQYHINYLNFLLKRRNWLAGDEISFADIVAASQISILDYLGLFDWDNEELIKDWYSVIKSRPSFRALLTDSIPSFKPPTHYADLDF